MWILLMAMILSIRFYGYVLMANGKLRFGVGVITEKKLTYDEKNTLKTKFHTRNDLLACGYYCQWEWCFQRSISKILWINEWFSSQQFKNNHKSLNENEK